MSLLTISLTEKDALQGAKRFLLDGMRRGKFVLRYTERPGAWSDEEFTTLMDGE